MNNLIQQFWDWAGKTPDEYARVGMNQNKGEFEDDFPMFNELLFLARNIVDNDVLDDDVLGELLVVMALDDEGENTLDYIEERSSDEQLERIIKLGMAHFQPNVRWQLAELICSRKPNNYYEYLLILSNDEHYYVRQRAKNLIEYLSRS